MSIQFCCLLTSQAHSMFCCISLLPPKWPFFRFTKVFLSLYKVVQIWPGQTVTCLHTISPGHIRTTL
jgi:hypothetical protein